MPAPQERRPVRIILEKKIIHRMLHTL
jgi:hypothetical protein